MAVPAWYDWLLAVALPKLGWLSVVPGSTVRTLLVEYSPSRRQC